MSSSEQNKKVLFIFTEDWAFSALFLDRAVAAREAGFDVAVHVRCTTHREIIEREGLRVIPHNISRSGTNPVSALWSIFKVVKVFRDFKPNIVHLIAIKPIVLGSLASFFYRDAKIINAPVGMGYMFASNDLRARILRAVVATNVPGCREAVEDGRNGLLVPPKNVEVLTAALTRLLDDDELRIRSVRN